MNRMDYALGTAAGILAGLKKTGMSRKSFSRNPIIIQQPSTADLLPARVARYYHPCHQHRFFMGLCRYPETVNCDNVHCKRLIQYSEVYLTCPKCEIDLCAHCFSKPLAPNTLPVPVAPDDHKINDSTFFVPYRYESDVAHVELKVPSTQMRHRHMIVPNQQIAAGPSEAFAGVTPVLQRNSNNSNGNGQQQQEDDDEDDEEDD